MNHIKKVFLTIFITITSLLLLTSSLPAKSLVLGGDKSKFEKNKVPFYVLFVFIAIIVYLILAKHT